jgi:hypothetical protein
VGAASALAAATGSALKSRCGKGKDEKERQ